jgi:hypothetical protein
MLQTLLARYKDMVLHFVAGLVVGAFVLIAERYFAPPPVHAAWAVVFAALMGAAKEALDHYENLREIERGQAPSHDVSVWDFLATSAGGGFVALLYMLHNH